MDFFGQNMDLFGQNLDLLGQEIFFWGQNLDLFGQQNDSGTVNPNWKFVQVTQNERARLFKVGSGKHVRKSLCFHSEFSKTRGRVIFEKLQVGWFSKRRLLKSVRIPVFGSGDRFPKTGFRKPFSENSFRKPFSGNRFSEMGFRKPTFRNRFPHNRRKHVTRIQT